MRLFFVLILFAFIACSGTNNKTTDSSFFDKEYKFIQTSDTHFCNTDSVMDVDCGLGSILFTKNGNIIYHFYCLGDDTTTYCIGKYEVFKDSIVCSFESDYSYAQPSNNVDPSKGKLKKEQHDKKILYKANCSAFEYYIPPTPEQREKTKKEFELAKLIGYNLNPFRGYVFSVDSNKTLTQTIKRIPKLKDL